MKRTITLILVLLIALSSTLVSFSEESTDANVVAALSDPQRNSIGVLNYLAYLTKEIEGQKGNRLYLENAYSAIYATSKKCRNDFLSSGNRVFMKNFTKQFFLP